MKKTCLTCGSYGQVWQYDGQEYYENKVKNRSKNPNIEHDCTKCNPNHSCKHWEPALEESK